MKRYGAVDCGVLRYRPVKANTWYLQATTGDAACGGERAEEASTAEEARCAEK